MVPEAQSCWGFKQKMLAPAEPGTLEGAAGARCHQREHCRKVLCPRSSSPVHFASANLGIAGIQGVKSTPIHPDKSQFRLLVRKCCPQPTPTTLCCCWGQHPARAAVPGVKSPREGRCWPLVGHKELTPLAPILQGLGPVPKALARCGGCVRAGQDCISPHRAPRAGDGHRCAAASCSGMRWLLRGVLLHCPQPRAGW